MSTGWKEFNHRKPIGNLATLVITALLGGCEPSAGTGTQSAVRSGLDSGAPVTVATAVSQDVPVQVRAIGWAETLASVTVRPQIEGQLVELHFKEGQRVNAGDLLWSIDSRPFVAALKLAEATLMKDQALSADAELEAARVNDLFQKSMAADREQQQTRANADAAKAQVEADRAAVDNANLKLEYCEIRSPIEGRAGARLVDRGNIVKANETPLVTINQLRPIYVSFAVAERHLRSIKQQLASGELPIEAEYTDENRTPSEGKLTFIDNQVDMSSGMVRMKGIFENEDEALWPGRFINIALTVSMLHDAVVVPTPAVQTGQKGAYVFVAKSDDTVELRSITLGPTLEGKTVITSGVSAGEVVVTDGQLRLVPGAKIHAVAGIPAGSPTKHASSG